MPKKSAALEAKFEIAVKTFLKAPNLTVQEAMLVAKLSMEDIENRSMQKILVRRIPGGKRARSMTTATTKVTLTVTEMTATVTMATMTRPQQRDHGDETTTSRYNNQLNGGPSAVKR